MKSLDELSWQRNSVVGLDLKGQRSRPHQTKFAPHSCRHHLELLHCYLHRKQLFFSFQIKCPLLYSCQTSPPSSALGPLAVVVHHPWHQALVLLHVLCHSLTDQLEDVLSGDAHGVGHFYSQHVQSQDGSTGDLNFCHHWLTQLKKMKQTIIIIILSLFLKTSSTEGNPTLSWHGFSQGNICLRPLPSALSTSRTERTSSASSDGSSEAAWSLPFHVLSKVTWRSMTFAPRATAATEILIPDSWPEYPMGISGNSFWYSCSGWNQYY